MDRVKRMQPVLRLAELEVDKAGRQLAMLQQRIQAETDKVDQLRAYQNDYRNRFQSAGKAGMSVDRLRLFDGFHQQIERAILQQQTLIIHLQDEQQKMRQFWQQKDIRYKSLQKMMERLEREAQVQQGRSEQRNHDEYARRRSGNRAWS